jgi:hypothetical protein
MLSLLAGTRVHEPDLSGSNLLALVQQLLPNEDAAKFVTGDQKERFQMADWRVRVPSQQHNDQRLPPEMMVYATGDVQFLAPVFVALANRSLFQLLFFCFLCSIFFRVVDSIFNQSD